MAEEDTGCTDDGKSQSEEIPVAKVVFRTACVRKGPSFSHSTVGHVQSGIAFYGHVVGDGNWLHLREASAMSPSILFEAVPSLARRNLDDRFCGHGTSQVHAVSVQ